MVDRIEANTENAQEYVRQAQKMFKMLKEQGNGQLKFVFYLEWLEN